MAHWRYGRGWSKREIRQYLGELEQCEVNFQVPLDEMSEEAGWKQDQLEASLGHDRGGELFERAKQALCGYEFSDPSIAVSYFDPEAPLLGRNMLLEFRAYGFHFLNGVRVRKVTEEPHAHGRIFGYRYETLRGHIESGVQWFTLLEDARTGEVRVRIEDCWQLGDPPNWWSAAGFVVIGEHFRERWRHRAVERLRRVAKPDPGLR